MHLRSEARRIFGKGMLLLFISFLANDFLMPENLIFLFIGFCGASIYIYLSIINIACPHCHKAYGVGVGFMGNIKVPTKCVCCQKSGS